MNAYNLTNCEIFRENKVQIFRQSEIKRFCKGKNKILKLTCDIKNYFSALFIFHGFYISRLARYARCYTYYDDFVFLDCNDFIKNLNQHIFDKIFTQC